MKRPHTITTAAKPSFTPKLRFPEFRDEPSWEDTPLSSVLTEHGEKSDGASEVHSVSVHKGVIDQVEHLGRSLAATDRSNYNLAKPNDVIYTKSPTGDFPYGVIKQNKLPYAVIVSPLYGVFSPTNRYLGYLLDAYFESPARTNNYLAPITQKGAKNTIQISNATFLTRGLCLPSNEAEQGKIAQFLSTLDELIGAESQELVALKAHKKGLMQELFPREQEITPRLRFPEFQNATEWAEKPISDLGEVITGNTPSTAKPEFFDGNIPFVSPGDISDLRFVSKAAATLTERGFREARSVRANSVLFVCIGATIGKVAQNERECATNQQINSVVPYPENFDAFVYYALVKNAERVAKLAGKHAVPIINKTLFSSVRVSVPKLGEQQRIASCLSTIDEMISAQSTKIQALKIHKNGLMQQLLPSPVETQA